MKAKEILPLFPEVKSEYVPPGLIRMRQWLKLMKAQKAK